MNFMEYPGDLPGKLFYFRFVNLKFEMLYFCASLPFILWLP